MKVIRLCGTGLCHYYFLSLSGPGYCHRVDLVTINEWTQFLSLSGPDFRHWSETDITQAEIAEKTRRYVCEITKPPDKQRTQDNVNRAICRVKHRCVYPGTGLVTAEHSCDVGKDNLEKLTNDTDIITNVKCE